MKVKKFTKKPASFIALVMAVVMCAGCVIVAATYTYNNVVNKDADPLTNQPAVSNAPIAIAANQDVEKIKIQPDKKIDLDKISVDSDTENEIKKSDAKNADKNFKNYKKLLAELDVPDKYIKEIKRSIKKGYSIQDVLTGYNFLSDNYGLIDELQGLLDDKDNNKSWDEVFAQYNKDHKVFVPRNFNSDYLENLLKTPGITADDVMIADHISQKKNIEFDKVIDMKKDKKSWKSIKEDLNIVNMDEELPHVSVTSDQIHKYTKDGSITEKQALEAISIAQKTHKDCDEIIAKVKKHEKKEMIYKEIYDGKYK